MEKFGDLTFIIGQVAGIIALIFSALHFFQKKKTAMMLTNLFSHFFNFFHYLLIGAISGSYTRVIAAIRDHYVYYREKNHKKHHGRHLHNNPLFFIGMSLLYIALIAVEWKNPTNTLPLWSGFIYFFFEWFGNKFWIKLMGGITTLPWLAYDIISLSIPGLIQDIILIISSFLGLYKDEKNRKNHIKRHKRKKLFSKYKNF